MITKPRYIHIHAMTVHFTNALFPVSTFFMYLFLFTRNESFASTYYHILGLAIISTPISYLSGAAEWKLKYNGAWVKIFTSKMILGAVLFICGLCCVIWYQYFPRVLHDGGILRIVFTLLNSMTVPLVVYLGHLGGKLAFTGPH